MDIIQVTLAKNYDPDKHNVNGWYASEKLDGVRAVFTGTDFITRNGNKLRAPQSFIKRIPKTRLGTILDGELYLGPNQFNKASGIVRSHDSDWAELGIRYHVFDIIGLEAVFVDRYRYLQDDLDVGSEYVVQLVNQTQIDNADTDIPKMMEEILKSGGEGLMLKHPFSIYETKRTSNLLKVKKFQDMEAVCIGVQPGLGKHEGRIGALVLQINGKTFKAGSGLSDQEREAPEHYYIGKQITVKYFELSKDGIPRFPIFKGIRTDLL